MRRTTAQGSASYSWSAENKPISITGADGVLEDYRYDADGARVKQVRHAASGDSYSYHLGGLWEERSNDAQGASPSLKSYYQFGGKIIALRHDPQSPTTSVNYMHGDHLGSVALVTSGTAPATVLSSQEFDPWGALRSGGVTQTSIGYTGQRRDETGLLFYNARYYDPALARFISADSIVPGVGALTVNVNDGVSSELFGKGENSFSPRMPQDLNRYSYVRNSPISNTDPTGHECQGNCIRIAFGWVYRVDSYNYRGESSFEIHVWNPRGEEVGFLGGVKGWFNKHRIRLNGPPDGMPGEVLSLIGPRPTPSSEATQDEV